jgi:hypothetical protein
MSAARRCLLLLLLVLTTSSARAQRGELPAVDQRYEIEATLDAHAHTLTASEHIVFTNHSPTPLHELYFHLYLNAFRDGNSVFMREGGAQLRGESLGQRGGISLSELAIEGETDPLAHSEPELIAGDRTQLRVPLRRELAPGAVLHVQLRFVAQLPALVARSGFASDFHLIAQWFPKLARLEEDGQWASFPYHGLGEFYADFADYRVSLTVPRAYVVGGSGTAVASRVHGALRTDEFRARAVHDVAFAAYPYFERLQSLEHGVHVSVLAPRGYAAAAARQMRVVQTGLAAYGARFGPYPYDTLTVIIPPADAQAAAGMEYPTFCVSAGPWWTAPALLPDPRHDLVAAHELAHQWFSGMIANNEVAYPMLDEGLAQWATLSLLRELYTTPPSLFARHPLPFDPFDVTRMLYQRAAGPVPSSLLPAHAYRYEDLARAVYLRPALVLEALAKAHGQQRLDSALGRYAREQRFRHPALGAFFAAFDREYGRGFSDQQLRPALQGDASAALPEANDTSQHADHNRSFFAQTLLAAQALLQGIGP